MKKETLKILIALILTNRGFIIIHAICLSIVRMTFALIY